MTPAPHSAARPYYSRDEMHRAWQHVRAPSDTRTLDEATAVPWLAAVIRACAASLRRAEQQRALRTARAEADAALIEQRVHRIGRALAAPPAADRKRLAANDRD